MSEPPPTIAPPQPAAPSGDEAGLACPIPQPQQGWTGLERAEAGAILLGVLVLFALVREVVWTVSLGKFLAYAAALFLAQGLVRDLVRLALEGRQDVTKTEACLCAESSVGVVALLIGLGLLLLGVKDTVTLGGATLSAIVAAVLVAGFVAKDYVISIRKERNHGSVSIF